MHMRFAHACRTDFDEFGALLEFFDACTAAVSERGAHAAGELEDNWHDAAFVFHFPIKIVYFFLMCDEFLKIPLVLHRYKKKKWLKNITRDIVA